MLSVNLFRHTPLSPRVTEMQLLAYSHSLDQNIQQRCVQGNEKAKEAQAQTRLSLPDTLSCWEHHGQTWHQLWWMGMFPITFSLRLSPHAVHKSNTAQCTFENTTCSVAPGNSCLGSQNLGESVCSCRGWSWRSDDSLSIYSLLELFFYLPTTVDRNSFKLLSIPFFLCLCVYFKSDP